MNESYTTIVKQLVDDLKAISANAGLGGEAGEYNLVTQSFLYKFLNDKFLFEIKKLHPNYDYEKLASLSEDEYTMLLDFELGTNAAHLHPRHLIEDLYKHQNEDDFAKTFDDTLNDIAV
ncbi:SAM-dependent DNA methyltransferase, partial [Listeria monocytogenes]|nr:SAM-dependent DNA methyltransferase [Listeria monocytogenes]